MDIAVIPDWVKRYETITHPLPGWFSDDDLHLFALIDKIQGEAHVTGNLLEVGAYLGKSSVVLGFMCRENESLTVIDPWDSKVRLKENAREQDRWYQGATVDKFITNYRRVHHELPDIRQGVSSEQLKRLPADRFRFIHIDGSHEWRTILEDVDEVLRLLSPGGVVAFDDLFAPHCPGVGAAVWPVCARGDLVPVATTGKLYATRGPSSTVNAVSVARAVEDDPELRVLDRHPVFGRDVLEVTASRPPLLAGFRRYIPPLIVDVARQHNLGKRIRAILPLVHQPGTISGES